jgi:hypothetical protein
MGNSSVHSVDDTETGLSSDHDGGSIGVPDDGGVSVSEDKRFNDADLAFVKNHTRPPPLQLTAAQINKLVGVSGARDGHGHKYAAAFAFAAAGGTFANGDAPTPSEIQTVVDSVNMKLNVRKARSRERPDIWLYKQGKVVGVKPEACTTTKECEARNPTHHAIAPPPFQNAANPWDLRRILLPAPTCRCWEWEAKHVSIGPDSYNEAKSTTCRNNQTL